jgi:hypothetical protein
MHSHRFALGKAPNFGDRHRSVLARGFERRSRARTLPQCPGIRLLPRTIGILGRRKPNQP